MPLSAFLLVVAAAGLHATWNVLLARSRDVRAAVAVVLALSVLLFAPAAAATWRVEAAALPWIAASAALELGYFGLLTSAYARSELSLVYPIARGSAPVLVLVGGAIVGSAVGVLQGVGVILVGVGVLLVRGVQRPIDSRGVLLALAVASTIAGYTLVDKEGIRHASTVAYLELVLTPVAATIGLLQLASGGSRSIRSQLSPAALGAAVCSFGAYALVLGALSLAAAAAVAAVRETSILFAVALGATVLGEPVGRFRAAGAAVVVAGVALVALG